MAEFNPDATPASGQRLWQATLRLRTQPVIVRQQQKMKKEKLTIIKHTPKAYLLPITTAGLFYRNEFNIFPGLAECPYKPHTAERSIVHYHAVI